MCERSPCELTNTSHRPNTTPCWTRRFQKPDCYDGRPARTGQNASVIPLLVNPPQNPACYDRNTWRNARNRPIVATNSLGTGCRSHRRSIVRAGMEAKVACYDFDALGDRRFIICPPQYDDLNVRTFSAHAR